MLQSLAHPRHVILSEEKILLQQEQKHPEIHKNEVPNDEYTRKRDK
ncbi:hypothetical protein ACFPUW_08040 [Thalassorhabdus alkalitolerans]